MMTTKIYLRKLDSCARSLFACDCERVFDKGTSIANRFLANAPIFCFSEPVDSRRFFVYARIMNKIRLKTFLVARKMFRRLLLVVCWFFHFSGEIEDFFFFKIQQAKNTERKESHKNSECFVTRSWKTSERCAKAEADGWELFENLF